MQDESSFLEALRINPDDSVVRSVYADWLEEQGDRRGKFLRLHLALRSLPPDHVHRVKGEEELSRLRKGVDPNWLALAEPERAHLYLTPPQRQWCQCGEGQHRQRRKTNVEFHLEPQDTECDAWKKLLDAIEKAALDGRQEFRPSEGMNSDDWARIVTLPPTIATLKEVRRLSLSGSQLVRIPPEIAGMTSLEEFNTYTSYRLHWFPYEITHCNKLSQTKVSTRALYGNWKYRQPFPRLQKQSTTARGQNFPILFPAMQGALQRNCSVCNRPFEDWGVHRVWVSLWVATDVLPLLVNACSNECVQQLPKPPDGYVQVPHRGGLSVKQPTYRLI